MTDVGSATFRALAEFGGLRRESKATSRDIKALKRDIQNLDTDITFEADTSKVRPQLSKGVKAAVEIVEAKDATVEFDADTSGMRRAVSAGAKAATASVGKDADVEIGADTSGMRRAVSAGTKAATAGIDAKVPVQADTTGLRERIRAGVAVAQRGIEAKIPVKADTKGVGKGLFAAVGGSIDFGAIGEGVTSMLKIPGALAAIKVAGPVFASLAAGAVGLVAALGPLLGILGAIPVFAITAAAGIGTLFAAFSGIGAALKAIQAEEKSGAATSSATAKATLAATRRREAAARGVQKAVRAVADAEVAAAERTESANQAAVRAAEDLVDAQEAQRRGAEALDRAYAQASRSIVDAQHRELRAQEELNRAREDAVEALQQMRFEQERNSISEERATLAVEDAVQRLADTNDDVFATERDRREAVLDLRDAEESLREIQDKRADDALDLADAEAKGVEGAEAVVAAREAQTDAARDTADAQQELADVIRDGAREHVAAARDVVRAQQALADAVEETGKVQVDNARSIADAQESLALALQESEDAASDLGDTGSSSINAVADAMDNLSPAGQRFVRFLLALKPALDEIRFVAQEGLFPGVQDGITSAIGLLPILKDIVRDTAVTFGDLARRAGEFAGSSFFKDALRQLGGTGNTIIRDAGDASLLFADALTRMAVAAQPLAIFLGNLLERAGQAFDTWIRGAEASGSMTKFFGETADVVDGLVDILGNLFSLIGSVLGAAKPLGDDIFGGLAAGLERAAEWADSFKGQSALRDFFESARPILKETWGLLGDIVKLFGSIFTTDSPEAAGMIAQIRREIIPALADILKSTSHIGPPLIELARAFLEFFGAFATESGPLIGFVETLTKILDTVTELMEQNPELKKFVFTLLVMAGGLKAFASVGSLLSPIVALLTGLGLAGLGVVVALAAIGAAFYLAYTNIQPFRDAVDSLIDGLQQSFSDAVEWVKANLGDIEEAVGHVLTVLLFLWDHFGEDFLERVKIVFAFMAEAVNAGLDIVRGIIEFILAVINGDWGKAWDAILTILRGVWDLIVSVLRFQLELALNTIQIALDAIRAVWDAGWEIISGIFGAIWDGIVAGVKIAINAVKSTIETVLGAISTVWSNVWGAISGGFGAIWDGIAGTIRSGVQLLIDILNTMIGGVNTILGILPGNLKIPTIPDIPKNQRTQQADARDNLPTYYSKGGQVPGGGPDRDSVHAVLTPGEFVVRRSAVKAFGQDRLEQINKMGYNRGGAVGTRENPVRRALGGLIPNPIDDVIDLGGKIVSGAAGVLRSAADVAKEVAQRGAYAVWSGIRKVAEAGLGHLPFGDTAVGKMIRGVPLKALDAIGNFIKGNDPGPAASSSAKGIDPAFLAAFKDYSARLGPLSITSGFRTAAQQAVLFKTKPGLAAPPGKSNHERGLAIDHAPHSTPSMRQKAVDFGLWYPMASLTAATAARAGGKYEPWHVEPIRTKKNLGGLVTVPQFDLGGIVDQDGIAAVHRKEMVLPEKISAAVQKMAERGSSGLGVRDIIVYNPVAEPASQSVTKVVRKLSYLGDL